MVTSQALSLERLARPVADAGAPAHEAAVIGDLDDEDVAIALRECPELHRLVFQGELRGPLRRPKLLQVVFQTLAGAADETLQGVSDESAIADLWWDQLALGAADRAPRSEFLRGLADWTARNLVDALPAGQLGAANLSAYAGIVDSLRAEEILNA